MQLKQGETWRFRVLCREAERVYLVQEPDIGPSAWIEMDSRDGSHWEITHHVTPGSYRFRYFRADGSTFLNCGNHGLSGERITLADPAVHVESVRYAVPA